MPMATCKLCGKVFYVRPSRVMAGKGLYCSRECYFFSKEHSAKMKQCEQCGQYFSTKSKDQRFCSRKCAEIAGALDGNPPPVCMDANTDKRRPELVTNCPYARGVLPTDAQFCPLG